jgi:hypothetical protein
VQGAHSLQGRQKSPNTPQKKGVNLDAFGTPVFEYVATLNDVKVWETFFLINFLASAGQLIFCIALFTVITALLANTCLSILEGSINNAIRFTSSQLYNAQ